MTKKGLKHVWRARTSKIDFLQGNGGFFGVSLILNTDMANRFCKNLEKCLRMAEKNREREIEILAHWGRKKPGRGYLLRNRVKTSE